MKFLGSKTLETKRLLLHKTEEKDLKILWQILLNKDISKYYLTSKINNSWEEEEKWQYKKLERASNNDVFSWTIELKDTHDVIGQISVQESTSSRKDIRDIGWFIDTQYQRKGYAYEAALEVLKYMFLEVEIKEINTSSAIVNDASWKLMEKLGFKRQKTTHMEKYTFLDNPIEVYEYIGTKKDFLKEYFRKESLYITEDIDKEPYMKHLSDDPVINITGESGSGKTTMIEDYKDLDAIIIDTDKIYEDSSQEVKHYLQEKYGYLPDICKEFDKVYLGILEYYKDSNKLLIIDSAQFRNIQDISILKGEIIVLRTCINTCYKRCIERFNKNNPNATMDELAEYTNRKKGMYKWYHSINNLIDKLDREGE